MTSQTTSPVNHHQLAPVEMSPRERARSTSDALLEESKWFAEFARDVFLHAPLHGEKAREAEALGKSCKLLAMRMRTWANT